ncbi:MAG: SDR family NAD(P)-dependent oxidoreductase [Sphaerochaetaceae bacterium]|jgi:NAD(P)-dependent dehydrogenase (short-subunit alcohol dehydrogenase family)
MKLENKVAVISGGAQGIGNAIAELFIQEGAKVAILDIDEQFGKSAMRRIDAMGGDGLFLPCDVQNEHMVRQALSVVVETYGTVDILVNDAAWQLNRPLLETSWDEFREVMDINIGGTFLMTREVAKIMIEQKKGGAIVNLGSSFSFIGSEGYCAYHASKGAVSSFTRAAAVALLPYGIRVNAVAPGTVLTPGLRVGARGTGNEESGMQSFLEKQPLGRFGRSDEIAKVVLTLASDDASFVYGAEWVVDGAYTVAR